MCVGRLQHRYLTELGRVLTSGRTILQLTMMIRSLTCCVTDFRMITMAPVRCLFYADDSLVENRLCLQCRIKLLEGPVPNADGGPCPLSLPSPYPCRILNSLPFKVAFGTYRHNDDKCTHTD